MSKTRPIEVVERPGFGERGVPHQTPLPGDTGALTPGSILLDRYRIIGLLGQGGMGEVYRADDLKLGQPIALKFLPPELERNTDFLDRLHKEASIARQISHPNVCRTYDITEVNGRHFIAMEYVDGEDLASLLRRIGRLPQEKGLQIAGQIAAGLAAAHETGVLHRDLKPANIMIDGRGRVRIMDFGLAVPHRPDDEASSREGTPAYMAPEQMAGKQLSERTDLYALGLILYEIFTGRRAFEDATPSGRMEPPRPPSDLVTNLDPAIDSIILRCLDDDPARRPDSAMKVAAVLPGSGGLAAILASGQTPTPEMVAEAGVHGALRPGVATALLAFVVVGLFLIALSGNRALLLQRIKVEKSTPVLTDRAKTLLEELGHLRTAGDEVFGYETDENLMDFLDTHSDEDAWKNIDKKYPPLLTFWYRLSTERMDREVDGGVTLMNPAYTKSGMAGVRLDLGGNLVEFIAASSFVRFPTNMKRDEISWQAPKWATLLEATGLDTTSWERTGHVWTPPLFCDRTAAWSGVGPDGEPIQIEAGAFKGDPVYLRMLGSWSTPDVPEPVREDLMWLRMLIRTLGWLILVSITMTPLVGAVILARRNTRLARTDRKGAFRLAVCAFSIGIAVEFVTIRTVDDILEILVSELPYIITFSLLVWLFYLALEPPLRRRWPDAIVSWTRILAGRFKDQLVGRDVLVGATAGVAMLLILRLGHHVAAWSGSPQQPYESSRFILLGPMQWISEFFFYSVAMVLLGLFIVLITFWTRIIRVRWQRIASQVLFFLLYALTMISLYPNSYEGPLMFWLIVISLAVIFYFLIIRMGVLPTILAFFVLRFLSAFPVTLNPQPSYSGARFFAIGMFLALVIFGYITSRKKSTTIE